MGRRSEFHTRVGTGERAQSVGYSPTVRDGCLGVRFVGPDGRRVEKMTDIKAEFSKKDEDKLLRPGADYEMEAARIIAKAFAPVYPDAAKKTWEDALQGLAADLREDTHIAYEKAVRIFRETMKEQGMEPANPAAVSPELAARFGPLWMNGTYKRGKATDAKTYKRKPTTLNFYLRQLSAVWEQWIPQGFVKENVWHGVRRPTVDKNKKRVPSEVETAVFFAWVKARYPEWDRLHALLKLKALSACRTADICELRSEQLKDGRIVWEASQTKQREGRTVLLPEDLAKDLKRLAGPTYLWEGMVEDLKKFRPSRPRPVTTFTPDSLYWVICNVFKEYGEEHPDQKHFTPHALRRRAITLLLAGTQSMDATGQAAGVTPATARAYYADMQRAIDTDAIFKDLAVVLVPKDAQTDGQTAHTKPTQKRNSEEPRGTKRNHKNGKKT